MKTDTLRVIHIDDIPLGGFAGIVELITEGVATANGISVSKGDLLEGSILHIEASSNLGIVLIH